MAFRMNCRLFPVPFTLLEYITQRGRRPWRGLLVPLTGLFRGCEGRYGNARTRGAFQSGAPFRQVHGDLFVRAAVAA